MMKRFVLSIFAIGIWIVDQVHAIEPLPQPIIEYMATREERHHHVLWHNLRNTWLTLDNETQEAIRALGWEPPHPSQNVTEEGRVVPLAENLSGEDFLYMHRQMIGKAREIGRNMTPPYEFITWDILPPPEDPDYPVPPMYDAETNETTASVLTWKSNDTYWNVMKLKDAKFKSPNYLKNVSLSRLGSNLEYELHNGIHMRWSEITDYGLRVRPPNPMPDIETKWDNETYDWLIDSYSSQVNPYFYKIHFWIDDRVNDWMAANNVTELVWNGTWTGGPMEMVPDLVQVGEDHNLKVDGAEIPAPNLRGSEMSHDMNHMHGENQGTKVDVMAEVMKILAKAGVKDHYFYDGGIICDDGEVVPTPLK